ncbi:MAG: HAD hydrolase-like protein [Nanoarchaeota archaeon]|nr:HAD hydrolase-like protein [Nanoarchaeota archaeon]MBU1621944.1 HAD hydrolase-like protein [Nanoarchaeota archaeon]
MFSKILPLGLKQAFSTRDKIVELLSAEWPLSTRRLHHLLKMKYATSITYQAVHKLLHQLQEEQVVVRLKHDWKLNENWVEDQALFFKKVNTLYKQKNSLLGEKLKIVAFDVNGVLTSEMTHVEFAKNSPHYEEIKRLITIQTLGKVSIKYAFHKLAQLMKGISLFDVLKYSGEFSLMPGVEETIKKLKEQNVKLGLVTTGFKISMECLNNRLGNPFDFIISNELVFVDDKSKELSFEDLNEIIKNGDEKELKKIKISELKIVIDKKNKKTSLLRKYLIENNLEFKFTCCVGDSMGDADFIKIAGEEGGMGIAFNPNLSLLEYAHYLKNQGKNVKIVESKDLRDILSLFT